MFFIDKPNLLGHPVQNHQSLERRTLLKLNKTSSPKSSYSHPVERSLPSIKHDFTLYFLHFNSDFFPPPEKITYLELGGGKLGMMQGNPSIKIVSFSRIWAHKIFFEFLKESRKNLGKSLGSKNSSESTLSSVLYVLQLV